MLKALEQFRHRRFRRDLSAYVDDTLSEQARRRLEAHLHSCEACRQELAELRTTVEAVGSLPMAEVPRSFRLAASPVAEVRPRPAASRLEFGLRLATATAAFVLALVVVGDFSGLPGGGEKEEETLSRNLVSATQEITAAPAAAPVETPPAIVGAPAETSAAEEAAPAETPAAEETPPAMVGAPAETPAAEETPPAIVAAPVETPAAEETPPAIVGAPAETPAVEETPPAIVGAPAETPAAEETPPAIVGAPAETPAAEETPPAPTGAGEGIFGFGEEPQEKATLEEGAGVEEEAEAYADEAQIVAEEGGGLSREDVVRWLEIGLGVGVGVLVVLWAFARFRRGIGSRA
jgi:hypothetical protein